MRTSNYSKTSPWFILSMGILAISTSSILIRLAQGGGAPSLAIATYRMTLATVLLLPSVLTHFRNEILSLKISQILWMFTSGILLTIHFAVWITSLEYTSVASSVVLVSTTPLWVAILSGIIFKESFSKRHLIGLALALAGSGLVGLSDSCRITGILPVCDFSILQPLSDATMKGNILALLGALTAAGYMMIGKAMRKNVNLVPYTFIVYGLSAVMFLCLVGVTRVKVTGFNPLIYVWLIAVGVIPQLIGHSSFTWALKYFSASFVTIAMLGEPIGATLLAALLFGEHPGWIKIIGGVCILSGIFIVASIQRIKTVPEKG
jgi:drug/metabolite transporter (DMT)-like permease